MPVRLFRRGFTENDGACVSGASDLPACAYDVGRERVARLMRRGDIRARPPWWKLTRDKYQRPVLALTPCIQDRCYHPDRPKRCWAADLTCIRATGGWLYVAVVIDLFSRRVVGRSMKNRMKAGPVTDALMMAIWRRGPADKLLHHSNSKIRWPVPSVDLPFSRLDLTRQVGPVTPGWADAHSDRPGCHSLELSAS